MHAVVITEPGGPEVLQLARGAGPGARAGRGAHRRRGRRRQPRRPDAAAGPLPAAAGRAAVPGPGVLGPDPHRRRGRHRAGGPVTQVCALLSGGGYAEQVVVPAGQVLPVPARVDVIDGGGAPRDGVHGVLQRLPAGPARPPGRRCWSTAAAAASARWRSSWARPSAPGSPVTAGSARKLARCRELGADMADQLPGRGFRRRPCIDATGGAGADVILDIMGASYLARNLAALATGRPARHHRTAGRQPGRARPGRRCRASGPACTRPRCAPGRAEQKAAVVAAVRDQVWPLIGAGRIARSSTRSCPCRRRPRRTGSWRPATTSARSCCGRNEPRRTGQAA